MRASWRGNLRLSLVSVPVQAFNAQDAAHGGLHFNQLHESCHSRIRYKKVCPIHGEVENSEIVSGYEYAKGQYAIIDPDELDELRSENDKAISIEQFIKPEQLDPIYLEGRSYYLIPDLPSGGKAYTVLHDAMVERNRVGIATVVFSGKEQLVAIRPIDKLLMMAILSYESEVRQPSAFTDIPEVHYSAKELQLAEMLVDASTVKHFDLGDFEDVYRKRISELIESKVEGKEITSPAEITKQVSVINLMDALRKSIDTKQTGRRSRRPVAAHAKARRRKHA